MASPPGPVHQRLPPLPRPAVCSSATISKGSSRLRSAAAWPPDHWSSPASHDIPSERQMSRAESAFRWGNLGAVETFGKITGSGGNLQLRATT